MILYLQPIKTQIAWWIIDASGSHFSFPKLYSSRGSLCRLISNNNKQPFLLYVSQMNVSCRLCIGVCKEIASLSSANPATIATIFVLAWKPCVQHTRSYFLCFSRRINMIFIHLRQTDVGTLLALKANGEYKSVPFPR